MNEGMNDVGGINGTGVVQLPCHVKIINVWRKNFHNCIKTLYKERELRN